MVAKKEVALVYYSCLSTEDKRRLFIYPIKVLQEILHKRSLQERNRCVTLRIESGKCSNDEK